MDLVPDVLLGRIPVHSMIEVNALATRLVSYQKRLPRETEPSYDLLIVSANVDQFYGEQQLPETWRHFVEITEPVPSQYDLFWVAEEGCLQSPYEEISPATISAFLDGSAESGGGSWRVDFGGHGGWDMLAANYDGYPDTDAEKVFPSDLRDLVGSGGMFCTAWAFNCGTGQFWNPLADTTICETWLGIDSQSSDAPLGPSYVGNVYQGLNSLEVGGSPSHLLNRWFLDVLYNQQPAVGARGQATVFNQAKLAYIDQWLSYPPGVIPPPIEITPGDVVEPMWDLLNFNLIGDPACPLWLTEPLGMTVQHVTILNAPVQFTVTVTDAGNQPIQGARVCLLLERNSSFVIYRRGQTNSSGQYSVYLDPSSAGTMTVTVTKEGYLPYQGSVAVRV
ncbi:MAG: Ig-like domain-containing protein [Candidatus Fermentibacter sp.]|nr:Ig-like domain-containing protein [Candidatus Fermentibacter sp.]